MGINLKMGEVLPALPFWQARSFWLMLLAIVAMVAQRCGVAMPMPIPWANDPATVCKTMQGGGGVVALLAWREHRAQNFRLTL